MLDLIVIVDPGHGGGDTGNVHNGITEAPLVYGIARDFIAAATLEGFAASLTRGPDEDPYHSERNRRALAAKADVLFSIHADAQPGGGTNWRGSTVFHWGANRRAGIIASVLAAAMPEELRRGRRGRIKRLPDTNYPRATNVVGALTPPTVLLECGYCTNELDAYDLKNAAIRRKIIEALLVAARRAAEIYGRQ